MTHCIYMLAKINTKTIEFLYKFYGPWGDCNCESLASQTISFFSQKTWYDSKKNTIFEADTISVQPKIDFCWHPSRYIFHAAFGFVCYQILFRCALLVATYVSSQKLTFLLMCPAKNLLFFASIEIDFPRSVWICLLTNIIQVSPLVATYILIS